MTLGEERRKKLNVCILGDDVSKLKPDPLIYVTASERLNIDPSRCVVIEDSLVGLKAAKGAVRVVMLISHPYMVLLKSCTQTFALPQILKGNEVSHYIHQKH